MATLTFERTTRVHRWTFSFQDVKTVAHWLPTILRAYYDATDTACALDMNPQRVTVQQAAKMVASKTIVISCSHIVETRDCLHSEFIRRLNLDGFVVPFTHPPLLADVELFD